MNKIKFLHCSDLHLGCMPNHLEERYEDFFISFKYIIEQAIKNECKYILISGDLFHLKVVNSKTLLKVIENLDYAINNNIKIIVIEGNHDKAFYVDENSWLHFLHKKQYITLLTHKIIDGNLVIDNDSIYEDQYIRIIGLGYLGSTTQLYLKNIEKKIIKSNKFSVLMLHAAINRLCGEDMGDISEDILLPLKNTINYVALGHIHTKYEYNDFLYNPGSIENIRVKDGKRSDKKGYYIVSYDINNNQKEVQFYISKQRKISNISLKLDNNMNLLEVSNYIKEYQYHLEKDSVLELTIYGTVFFNPYLIDFDNIKETLKQKHQLLYIEINNLINIIVSDNTLNNIIDIKEIERKAIEKYISINYPQFENISTFIDEMQNIKEALIDEKENTVIIDSLVSKLKDTEGE